MSRAEPPRIDKQTYNDLIDKVEKLIQEYTGGAWKPGGHDVGSALVRIFGRMAELVVTRLNRLPDRDFLAFLDLIGTRLNPPQPARVPLTFLLAAGSPVDALVPAGTQAVATALEGEAEPPLFATERDLVVTRSQLVAVYSREPERDLWADHTAIATGQGTGTFRPFRGDRQIEHRLYVDHPLLGLPERKTVELRIDLADGSPFWPSDKVAWSFWNGVDWQPLLPGDSEEVVRFDDIPGFAASPVNGVEGHWLRGELETDGGDLRQPYIDALAVRITIDRTDVSQQKVPERGFANQIPLDLSTDFLPFGEKPKVGDVFYLASDEALAKPGATVDLYVALSNGTLPAANDLLLVWELWNGREWQLLGNSGATGGGEFNFRDGIDKGTNGFLQSGSVRFTVPPSLAANEVNGEVRRWLRVRIARGNYGVEARYVPVEVNGQPQRDEHGRTVYELIPATFRPPSLRSVRLGYRYDPGSQPPRRLLTENDFKFSEVTVSPFTPFVPSADLRPTLYLGFDRPGDTTGFANRSAALFFQISEALFDPAVEQGEVTEEAAVVWEYWNGTHWERLGTGDETRGLTRRGLLSFIGPPDFKASCDFGRKAFWLRGRWERGEYAVEPQLTRILTNTIWAVHAQTIEGESLGSSRGEPEQTFRTLRAPVLEGQVLEVIEPEIPSGADLDELEAEEGDDAVTVVRDATGQLMEVRVRWHEVPDFHGSGPRSRHYVLEPVSGEVRFGDGRSGLVPPAGRNNVRMARYRAGGGLAGNRPPGSIARLKGTVPYIAGIVQSMAADGGAAEESLDAVRLRGPKALRHRNRAVAAADFEDLAFQASSQVARARALPARHVFEAGGTGLILVPVSRNAKPVPGLELLARVRSYLEERLSPVVDFWVTGPDWLQIDVQAEIVPRQLDRAIDVQNSALERLRAFLHPLSGGPAGDGWELGRKPYRSDLFALIEDTPGVDHVRRLEVIEIPREGGARPDRFQVFSGNHEITVRGNLDDAAADSGSPA
jgi:Baseplate J-like protein